MSRRALKYIKPEKIRHEIAAIRKVASETEEKQPDFSGSETNQRKGSKLLAMQSSTVDEKSNVASSDNDDGQEGSLQGDSLLQPSIFSQAANPVLYSITSGFRKAVSLNPRSKMPTESIQGRQRMSTTDPNTLKRLKFIKVDALQEDDQIEVMD